ncbi:MAG: 4Fe-4S binding protein [Candidatus Eremiobacteraeota bacterium]|nr:4Fe-4S binding protein [Candidatus Eremiobacteraeota bacterium]
MNLGLVEAHLPGPLWLAIGAIFWLALIGITLSGSGLVCGTMCWIGAIQDFFEPFARSRFRFDARLTRSLTLAILIFWMPIGWLLVPNFASHESTPLSFNLAWERHLFPFVLAALTAASVVFLGKRGICRYFCPFNSIVASGRKSLSHAGRLARIAAAQGRTPGVVATSNRNDACAGGCASCSRRDGATSIVTFERLTTR